MNRLLVSQLRKLGLDPAEPPTGDRWRALLERVDATYTQADQDRYMCERSLEQSSEEMSDLYADLRAASAQEIQKKSEALAASLALARAVQEAVADGIMVVGVGGRLLSTNAKFEKMLGIPSDLEPRTADAVLEHILGVAKNPGDLRAAVSRSVERPHDLSLHDLELEDGRIIERYAGPVCTLEGQLLGRVVCYRDVTEKRRLDAQRVVTAERMASVGQLVASVAHEINNPLTYVRSNVDLVVARLETGTVADPEHLEALRDAQRGVERIRTIVRDIKTLSRADEDVRHPEDVRSAMLSALQMAHNRTRHHADVVRHLDEAPRVSAIDGQLCQVFLNLLVNAADAIPQGRAAEHTIHVATGTSEAGWARIRVRDTGAGIPPEAIERIFDPFFTTKPVGAGMGLGLSICRRIVTDMGGKIDVASVVGEGTTFTVELPPVKAAVAMVRVDDRSGVLQLEGDCSVARDAPPSRRRVLIVDDEPFVRRALERSLACHDVLAVPSVAAATEALARGPFDAILCDLMMPDRTGVDLYLFIKASYPALVPRLVFLSGGAFTPALQEFVRTIPNLFIAKPAAIAELERAIELVCGGASVAP